MVMSTHFPSASSISPRDGSEPRYRPLQLQENSLHGYTSQIHLVPQWH